MCALRKFLKKLLDRNGGILCSNGFKHLQNITFNITKVMPSFRLYKYILFIGLKTQRVANSHGFNVQ